MKRKEKVKLSITQTNCLIFPSKKIASIYTEKKLKGKNKKNPTLQCNLLIYYEIVISTTKSEILFVSILNTSKQIQ